MRAVQITRFGGPEVLDVVDIAEPQAGPGQKLYDVSTAGVNHADTHPPCRTTDLSCWVGQAERDAAGPGRRT